ncbi:CapA family protein [Croceibacterium aestuarii]|uniref:CapA family protein n=1 Tax=Croceibacterium aestuarii TaxID=3064139 RepID=UPI00272E165E|nr:CapA family protein [Croceibacterium sp. D39]
MSKAGVEIVVTGDLVLDEPDADHWLSGIAPALRGADLAIGHLEVPHTDCRGEVSGDVPAPGAPPENLAAIARAGISMVSLAGNHIADCGARGIADTIAGLDVLAIAHAGAGMDIDQAREPAIVEAGGMRVALLSYNCVGPEFSRASASRAGAAYLPLRTANGEPVSPRSRIAGIEREAGDILSADIAAARQAADVVLVAMHKGRVHTPAMLESYERPIAQMAVERGADAVISHHAHIARGIEFHGGRPIFHGLGNGCVVTRALSPAQDHPARAEWARKRRELFGFEPEEGYDLAPFHPEAKLAFLGRITIAPGEPPRASIVPVFVEAPGRPVLAEEERAADVRSYLEAITAMAGLPPIVVAPDGAVREAV